MDATRPEDVDPMDALTDRLEELARALERVGAPAEESGRLLGAASVATFTAVALGEARRPPERRARGDVEILAPARPARPTRLRAA